VPELCDADPRVLAELPPDVRLDVSPSTCHSGHLARSSMRKAVPGRRSLTYDSAVGASAGARTISEGEASSMVLKTKITAYTSIYKDETGHTFEVTRDRHGVAAVRMVITHR
jgi:hypothetical protein